MKMSQYCHKILTTQHRIYEDSQKGSYAEPNESNLSYWHLFNIDSTIVFPSNSSSSKGYLLSFWKSCSEALYDVSEQLCL